MATLAALVVNHNGGELLLACLRCLLNEPAIEQVLVADNASSDGTPGRLLALAAEQPRLSCVFNQTNLGLSAALNPLAQKAADVDWLLLANPDAWPQPGAVERMLDLARSAPRSGLVGAWVVDEADQELRATRRSLPTPWRAAMTFTGLEKLASRWPRLAGVNQTHGEVPQMPLEVEAVSGAFMLVRREALENVGGMDEGFFLHCEDLDLFLRLRNSGYRILLEPRARVTHRQGTPSASAPRRVWWCKHRSMARYLLKHADGGPAIVLAWLLQPLVYLRGLLGVLWRS